MGYAKGVRALDRLVMVNGVDVRTYTMDEVVVLLRVRPLELHLVTGQAWPSCEHFLSGALTLTDWSAVLTALLQRQEDQKHKGGMPWPEFLAHFTAKAQPELDGYWNLVAELTGFVPDKDAVKSSPA